MKKSKDGQEWAGLTTVHNMISAEIHLHHSHTFEHIFQIIRAAGVARVRGVLSTVELIVGLTIGDILTSRIIASADGWAYFSVVVLIIVLVVAAVAILIRVKQFGYCTGIILPIILRIVRTRVHLRRQCVRAILLDPCRSLWTKEFDQTVNHLIICVDIARPSEVLIVIFYDRGAILVRT
jgi:hypothetical protein